MHETPADTSATRESEEARDSAPNAIAKRIMDRFATAYLTLASIIQGVALTTLVSRVEGAYSGFALADWVLSVATILAILAILAVWQEYLMQVLAYVWLPTFLDSLVPFGFVVVELPMGHLVDYNERAWLVA